MLGRGCIFLVRALLVWHYTSSDANEFVCSILASLMVVDMTLTLLSVRVRFSLV